MCVCVVQYGASPKSWYDVVCISISFQSPSSSSTRHVPCHARDIWAFGHMMLVLLEDTALECEAHGGRDEGAWGEAVYQ